MLLSMALRPSILALKRREPFLAVYFSVHKGSKPEFQHVPAVHLRTKSTISSTNGLGDTTWFSLGPYPP